MKLTVTKRRSCTVGCTRSPASSNTRRLRALRARNSHSAFTCVAGCYSQITLLIVTGASILVIAHHALW